jgi:hypothetical protein
VHDGEDPPVVVRAQSEPEFVVDVGDVPDHGLVGQLELLRAQHWPRGWK